MTRPPRSAAPALRAPALCAPALCAPFLSAPFLGAASVRAPSLATLALLGVVWSGLLLPPLRTLAQEPQITAAQPELPRQPLTIITRDGQRHAFRVEMALDPAQQTVGLMFRTAVPADGGMLFDWGTPRASQMWMRNTVIPLDMLFINEDGTIRRVVENTVPESLAVIDSRGPVRATLELAAGTAARVGIRAGDRVEGAIFPSHP